MTTTDAQQLLKLCDTILEDGELTGEEVYGLAHWLNENPDACTIWPGNLLVTPLQNVWADGRLTKSELHQIARLLLQIRTQHSKKEAQKIARQAADLIKAACDSFDRMQARVPLLPISLPVRSHSNGAAEYTVDLSGPNCSCADWRANRHHLPAGHLSRCCKHVFDAFHRVEPVSGWPEWLHAFFDLSWAPHPGQDWSVLPLDEHPVVVATPHNDWINLYAMADGSYDRFSYHRLEDRWSYEIKPPHDQRICSLLRNPPFPM